MRSRTTTATAALLLGLVLTVVLGACGGGGGDSDDEGRTKQAVEQLQGYGLTTDEARCMVEAIGAETVVEAADITALSQSDQYREASKACVNAD